MFCVQETTAQESNADNSALEKKTDPTNKDDNVIDAEDEASFTPVVSHSRKDRNSRRNKERGQQQSNTNSGMATGTNNNNASRQSQPNNNKSQRQPRSENGRSKDATHKRSKGNNHREDKDKSMAHSETATATGTYCLIIHPSVEWSSSAIELSFIVTKVVSIYV